MAETEGFLGRWSRLKREAEPPQAEGNQAENLPPEDISPPEAIGEEPEREPLPPIESLGADSDYTRFLAPDVPAELTRLALRKAWVSDPKIAGFRGFAEYDWDCNAPGYGQLRPTDNIRDLLDAVFGDTPPEPPEPVPVAEEPAETPIAAAEESPVPEQREQDRETSDTQRC